jgi:hypothetical protein
VPKLQLVQDPAADALLDDNPFALLVGMLLDQRWRSMTARVRVRWLTPLLTAARGCGSGGNSNGSGPAILGIGVGDREGDELCVPTSGDPARAERSQVDGGSERECWAA